MAAIDINSNALITPKEEKCETPPTEITDSRISDEPIAANPISVYIPVDCHHMLDMPTNKGKEIVIASTDEKMPETPSATQTSSSKRGRRPKPTPEWIGNWDVESKKRPHSDRFDKTYRHKEKGFLCRSLLECERYEKHGIRPKSRRLKKQEKEKEGRKKSKTETKLDNCEEESGVALLLKVFFKIWEKEMVVVNEKNKEAETEEAIVAKRREEAESMRKTVEEFLADAHYNQLRMFDP